MYKHGEPDGAGNVAGKDPNQTKLLLHVGSGVLLLGSLCHLKKVRHKAHASDVIEILSDMVCSLCFHPCALETELQCASTLLNSLPMDEDVPHVAMLEHFFGRVDGAWADQGLERIMLQAVFVLDGVVVHAIGLPCWARKGEAGEAAYFDSSLITLRINRIPNSSPRLRMDSG